MAHKNKTNISPYKTRQQKSDQDKKAKLLGKNNLTPATPSSSLKGVHKKPKQIFSQAEAQDRIYDIFRNHEFKTPSFEVISQLAHFYRLLMENQEKENFTRLLNLRDVAIKHYIDCLIVAQKTELTFPLLDVGTGPGFPGIPLKFLFPQEKVILAEGVQRRVEFLKKVRSEMNLENLPIIGRNINTFFAYPVNGVITRAVEDVRNTLKNVLTCLNLGGKVFLMKGPNVDPEIPVAEKEVGEFYQLEKDIAYDLPQTQHHRRLLVYKKIKPAPLIDFDEEPWPEDD
jgi:16S rRNA (guanine527-N7)-methyltransferase